MKRIQLASGRACLWREMVYSKSQIKYEHGDWKVQKWEIDQKEHSVPSDSSGVGLGNKNSLYAIESS